MCILAGAGSGKTRVLTRRIAYRAATDAARPPQRVLALTFTRKAAGELRSRLRAARPARHRRRRHLPLGGLRPAPRPLGRPRHRAARRCSTARSASSPASCPGACATAPRAATSSPSTSSARSSGPRPGGSRPSSTPSAAKARPHAAHRRPPAGRRSSSATSPTSEPSGMVDFDDLLSLLRRATSAATRPSPPRSAGASATSSSTSTRTSTRSSRRCSTRGSATAPTSAWWAIPTRPSTRGTAPTPATSTTSPSGGGSARSSASPTTTGRRRRSSRWPTRCWPAAPRLAGVAAGRDLRRAAGPPARRAAARPSRSCADDTAEARAIARAVRDRHTPGSLVVVPGDPGAHQRPDRASSRRRCAEARIPFRVRGGGGAARPARGQGRRRRAPLVVLHVRGGAHRPRHQAGRRRSGDRPAGDPPPTEDAGRGANRDRRARAGQHRGAGAHGHRLRRHRPQPVRRPASSPGSRQTARADQPDQFGDAVDSPPSTRPRASSGRSCTSPVSSRAWCPSGTPRRRRSRPRSAGCSTWPSPGPSASCTSAGPRAAPSAPARSARERSLYLSHVDAALEAAARRRGPGRLGRPRHRRAAAVGRPHRRGRRRSDGAPPASTGGRRAALSRLDDADETLFDALKGWRATVAHGGVGARRTSSSTTPRSRPSPGARPAVARRPARARRRRTGQGRPLRRADPRRRRRAPLTHPIRSRPSSPRRRCLPARSGRCRRGSHPHRGPEGRARGILRPCASRSSNGSRRRSRPCWPPTPTPRSTPSSTACRRWASRRCSSTGSTPTASSCGCTTASPPISPAPPSRSSIPTS